MKGFLHKAKDSLQKDKASTSGRPPPPVPSKPSIFQRNAPQGDQPSSISDPTPQEVLRYRYHHGANLGSIYVLEKWLHPSMFPSNAAPGQSSELEAVKLWISQIGMDAARTKFEAHWANAMSDDDLKWLSQSANCEYFPLLNLCPFLPASPHTALFCQHVASRSLTFWCYNLTYQALHYVYQLATLLLVHPSLKALPSNPTHPSTTQHGRQSNISFFASTPLASALS